MSTQLYYRDRSTEKASLWNMLGPDSSYLATYRLNSGYTLGVL